MILWFAYMYMYVYTISLLHVSTHPRLLAREFQVPMGPNTVCIWTDLNRVHYAIHMYYTWLLILVNHTRTRTHVLVLVRTILAIAHTRIHACNLARVD